MAVARGICGHERRIVDQVQQRRFDNLRRAGLGLTDGSSSNRVTHLRPPQPELQQSGLWSGYFAVS
jgi:hypothetical protein